MSSSSAYATVCAIAAGASSGGSALWHGALTTSCAHAAHAAFSAGASVTASAAGDDGTIDEDEFAAQ